MRLDLSDDLMAKLRFLSGQANDQDAVAAVLAMGFAVLEAHRSGATIVLERPARPTTVLVPRAR